MNRASILVPLLSLFGCTGQEPVGTGPPAAEVSAVRGTATWKAALIGHREEKDEELKSSKSSPMAGTQYLKSEPRDEVYLTRRDKMFELAYQTPADALLRLTWDSDSWHWSALETGIVCRAGDEEVLDGSSIEGPATFDLESLHLSFYPSEDRVTFIVFDPERPEKEAFEHLVYFAPDEKYAVDARLVELPEPEELEMLTSRNLKKTFYRVARIRFRLDGKDQELSAFRYSLTGDSSTTLFIPFRDRTTGKESYGAGRFLEIDEPPEEVFVLDFNRSFNPLCNYSPAYNCAIPPPENHLDVAVRAGERTYPTIVPH